MVTSQPHNIFAYIQLTHASITSHVAARYYLSWEDALWELIEFKKISKGSVALIPTFWCNDVADNMRRHGITCKTYPMDSSFQTSEYELQEAIRTYTPHIIIVFHAVGIRNNLLTSETSWMHDLTEDQIVIEDSVHSIVDPKDIVIPRDNYFVIDSWRKVVPIQGCALYGKPKDVPQTINHKRERSYAVQVYFWWFAMQIALYLQSKTTSSMAGKFGRLAEWCMGKGYDVIGDSEKGALTHPLFVNFHNRLDYFKIKNIKRQQVITYEKKLKDIIANNLGLFRINIPLDDFGELRGYPVGLKFQSAQAILGMLRSRGLYVRLELNECEWSSEKKVIFLPLGPHLSLQDIEVVCAYFLDALLQCHHDQLKSECFQKSICTA